MVDILKVSDDELPLLTGETDLDKGADQLLSYGASLVTVTLGAEGSFSKNAVASQQRPAYDVSAIDTTGAGDAFCGAMLYFISDKNKAQLRTMPAEELGEMLTFANVAGSLTVTKKGAIPAMPTKMRSWTPWRASTKSATTDRSSLKSQAKKDSMSQEMRRTGPRHVSVS